MKHSGGRNGMKPRFQAGERNRKITKQKGYIMKKRPVLLFLLAVLAPIQAEEINFDAKLSDWSKSNPKNTMFDAVEKVSKAGSLRLTANPNRPYVTVSKILELKSGQKYTVSFMTKGENISDKRTGVYVNVGTYWKRIVTFSDTFDWTKTRIELDPDRLGGTKIKFCVTLYGNTGKLWFDRLDVSPKQIKEPGEKTNYTIQFYPVNRENNCMTICENLPVILQLMAGAPPKFKDHYRNKSSRLIMDLPKYLKLRGTQHPPKSGWSRAFKLDSKTTPDKTFVRDGVEYQRYFVDFPGYQALFMCMIPDRFLYQLLFEAAPGSAGKTGKIYWSYDISGEKYPEHSFTVKVLPPAVMTEPPCREFRLAMYRQVMINHGFISPGGYDRTVKFWSSLSRSNTYAVPNGVGHVKKQIGDRQFLEVGHGDCISTLNGEEWKQMMKRMPADVSLKGKKQNHVSAWALVDDPDKIFENYLRTTFRKARDHKPAIDIVVWDFEPFGFQQEGCNEGGRKRFAEKMNLKSVPTIEELNGKYKETYYQYMLNLHTELARKFARILREEFPRAEFWICTGNLTARSPHYSRWACVDIRPIDELADVHFNMPYYTGTVFFDDVDYNVKHLKKPNFPIHYPSYSRPSFNYTPKRLLQNVVSSAAVGCRGAGFGESDILSGESQTLLARAFSMISRAEKFYFHGKRCDQEIQVIPRNAISRKLASGKTITSPDFSQVIRYTAHKLNGKYLVTVLNYHQSLPLIAEISGKDFKPVLVKVMPEGCEQVGTDLIPPQEVLKKEIASYSRGGDAFRDHVSGTNKAVWSAARNGLALIQLTDGKIIAGIDSIGSGEAVSLQTAAGKELLTDGFVGRIVFRDTLQPKLEWKTESYGLGKDNTPYLISTATVGAYEGAMPEPNPLQGMKISRRFEVKEGRLTVSFTFINPTGKEMPLALRLNNYPWPGFRFGAKNIVFNGKYDVKAPAAVTLPDNGEVQKLTAKDGSLTDEIRFRSKTKFDQIFSWTIHATARKTVEFLLDRKLAPGTSLTVQYEVYLPETAAADAQK